MSGTPYTPDLFDSLPPLDEVAAPLAPAADMLTTLQRWRDQGWLRRLDSALAGLVLDSDPQASPLLLLCTALLSQMEGRGHTCLSLDRLLAEPNGVLAWPTAAAAELQGLWAALPTDLARWCTALRASPAVRDPACERDQGQPLVLVAEGQAPRLYLRRYWDFERGVAAQVQLRSLPRTHGPSAATLRPWLDSLFPADPARPGPDWQKLACAVALRGRLSVITGGPGTGKTYTAARLLALLLATAEQPDSLRVALAAPTGKAAARLKQAIDSSLLDLQHKLSAGDGPAPDLLAFTQRMGAARTLHALLGARPDSRFMARHAGSPLDVDVLIVDEASMVHLEMMAALLDALPATATLVLLGDKDQLASVEAGAVLGDLCRDAQAGGWSDDTAAYARAAAGVDIPAEYLASGAPSLLAQHTVMLRESRRFAGPIGQLALAVNRGDAPAALQLLRRPEGSDLCVHEGADPALLATLALAGRPGAPGGYADYLRLMAQRPAQGDVAAHAVWVRQVLAAFDGFRLLCAVREGDWGAAGVNRAVARCLHAAGLLNQGGEWYAGRPVMVTRNDPGLGVFNGDIGLALPPASGQGLRVWLGDGESLRSVGVSRLAHVETAFAMTVHKSQGSEFAHTVLVLPDQAGALLSRELVYTGITRARQAFTLVAARTGSLDAAIEQPTRRASGLAATLAALPPALPAHSP
jgi:exodeoxyribonuclease V alpha subunit